MKLRSKIFRSNALTMAAVAKVDPMQAPPYEYAMPTVEVRMLRAHLLFEECMETIRALGMRVVLEPKNSGIAILRRIESSNDPDFEGIIDGCCDTIYVATGTLLACGAPDKPHLHAVCKANEAKFPEGKAMLNNAGKFQKPPGWNPPNHAEVMEMVCRECDLPFRDDLFPTT